MDDLGAPRRDADAGGGPVDAVVASVCRLVAGHADVRAAHVVTGHRPTYDELARCRRHADECGLRLAVIGSGGVALQRPAARGPRHPAAPSPLRMGTSDAIEPPGRSTAPWSIDQAIEVGCLAGPAAAGSIHVATGRPPTDAELARYRRLAAACGFALTATGTRVVLRPAAAAPRATGWPRMLARIRSAATRLLTRRPAAPT